MIKTRPALTSAAKAAEVLESCGAISEAARSEAARPAGVSRPTVYSWIERGLAFRHHITQATAASALARKLYNFTLQLYTRLTPKPMNTNHLPQKLDIKPQTEILYTAA